jgi:hypothetical protein
MWYTQREQAVLTSLWYCMTGVQLMVGSSPSCKVDYLITHLLIGWRNHRMGSLPLRWSRHSLLATSLPRSRLRYLCMGLFHWLVAP